MGQNQALRYISMNVASDVRQLMFGRVHQNVAPGAKSATYDCLVVTAERKAICTQQRNNEHNTEV